MDSTSTGSLLWNLFTFAVAIVGPQVTALGETATFRCKSLLAENFTWLINGETNYSCSNMRQSSIRGVGSLVLTNVLSELNGTMIQCRVQTTSHETVVSEPVVLLLQGIVTVIPYCYSCYTYTTFFNYSIYLFSP